MSKKKLIIVFIVVAVLIIGIVSIVFMVNNSKIQKEFKEQEDIYDKYVEISEKINNIIDDNLKPIDEATHKDIGTDKTKINELISKKEELEKYKTKINTNKITNLDKLKEEIQNLENSLKNIDEELIILKREEIKDYTLKENNKIILISKDITKLIEEINTLATKQEEKKKELEEKQQYVGTYKNSSGNILTVIISDDEQLNLKTYYNTSYVMTKKNDKYLSSNPSDLDGYTLFPIGKNIDGLTTDISKIRIMYYDLGISDSNVYYKQ